MVLCGYILDMRYVSWWFVVLGVLGGGTVFAQSSADLPNDTFIAQCPYIAEYLTAGIDAELAGTCANEYGFQQLAYPAFDAELKRYQRYIDRAYIDAVSHHHHIVESTAYQLRRHVDCLEQVCYSILTECSNQPEARQYGANVLAGYEWCTSAVQWVYDMQKLQVEAMVLERQARIHTDLMDGKQVVFHRGVRTYLEQPMRDFMFILRDMMRKITGLIQ